MATDPTSAKVRQVPPTVKENWVVPSRVKLNEVPVGTGDVGSALLQTTMSLAWATVPQRASTRNNKWTGRILERFVT